MRGTIGHHLLTCMKSLGEQHACTCELGQLPPMGTGRLNTSQPDIQNFPDTLAAKIEMQMVKGNRMGVATAMAAVASLLPPGVVDQAQAYETERARFELLMRETCAHMSLDRDPTNPRNYKWRAVHNMWQGFLLSKGLLK
jgi:hypothetical protein